METPSAASEATKILGSKGKKLYPHEVHIRRAEKGAFIARHLLRDKHGNPPADGQRSEMEYAIPDAAALASHVQEHMGEMPAEEDE